MWLYTSGKDKQIDNWILNRNYNLEYKLDSGEIQTLNNTLVNIDSKHYWFLSKDNGLDIIPKNKVITMICTDRH